MKINDSELFCLHDSSFEREIFPYLYVTRPQFSIPPWRRRKKNEKGKSINNQQRQSKVAVDESARKLFGQKITKTFNNAESF
jgi:hypothetical protein